MEFIQDTRIRDLWIPLTPAPFGRAQDVADRWRPIYFTPGFGRVLVPALGDPLSKGISI